MVLSRMSAQKSPFCLAGSNLSAAAVNETNFNVALCMQIILFSLRRNATVAVEPQAGSFGNHYYPHTR